MSKTPTIIKYLKKGLQNIPGWRTDRKIVVIESDDWGSIRMESRDTYNNLLSKGYPVDQSHYDMFDALESEDDLIGLFEVLSSVKDSNGNKAVLTANNIVANPDFSLIRNADLKEYFYEPFTETYKKYPRHANSFDLLKQGLEARIFIPQFHGREHLNIKFWMDSLRDQNPETLAAFNRNMTTFSTLPKAVNSDRYLAALRYGDEEERRAVILIFKEGLTLFRNTWGFDSKTFIAPFYFWHNDIEELTHRYGLKYIQGSVVQRIPAPGTRKGYKKKYHYTGQVNQFGQRYLVRNSFFEPSENRNIDWTGKCLRDISSAFRMKKPAIIQSHRVNYIGYIDPVNRTRNLRLLEKLLKEIVKRWPDVEFMDSEQLGKSIEG